MPIHLPPLSRRSFLRRTLAAASALALSPRVLAETAPESWALLADTHIAGDLALTNRNVNMADHLSRVVKDLLSRPAVAAALVAGDCAYGTGQAADYRRLAELVQPLRTHCPIHFLLGNHDHRERFWEGIAQTRDLQPPVVDRHVALLRGRNVNWFLLDSLEATNVTPGLLGGSQLDWLARTLDQNPTTPALVMIHHNPGVAGNTGLKDTVALFEILRPRKQVKAYIYGHTHAWGIERDETGLHLINLPPVAYVFNDQAPSGWVEARSTADALHLTLHSLNPQHPAHRQEHRLAYRSA